MLIPGLGKADISILVNFSLNRCFGLSVYIDKFNKYDKLYFLSMHTITSRILAFFLLLSIPSLGFASFSDVPPQHQYSKAISYISSDGIVSGYPDGSFQPNQHINRAEFTVILVRTLASPVDTALCSPLHAFADVHEKSWYAPEVCIAKKSRWITGYNDGTFRGSHTLQFAEAAKMLAAAFHLPPGSDTSAWYFPYTQALINVGALPPTVKFADQPVTRGEMAFMIHQLNSLPVRDSEDIMILDATGNTTGIASNGAELRIGGDQNAGSRPSIVPRTSRPRTTVRRTPRITITRFPQDTGAPSNPPSQGTTGGRGGDTGTTGGRGGSDAGSGSTGRTGSSPGGGSTGGTGSSTGGDGGTNSGDGGNTGGTTGGGFTGGGECDQSRSIPETVWGDEGNLSRGSIGWTFPGLIWGDCPITGAMVKWRGPENSAFGSLDF